MKRIIKKKVAGLVPAAIKWEIEHAYKFLINRNHEAAEFVNLSFSQEGEDLLLERLIGIKTDGFYVDIGAHHPFRFSNTYKFYLLGWRGINIDPLPGRMKLFDEKRPGDINLEMGIVSEPSDELIYYMFEEPAFNTFNAEMAQKRDEATVLKIQETKKIKTARLETVLDEHLPKNQPIDFLSIDVEGMDLEVLKSNDWKKYRPKYVLCESIASNLLDDLNADITIFMKEHQYSIHAKAVNSLIYSDNRKL